METPKCPVCSGEMRLVPAGVSKTSGKPYNSFWGCKTWECKGSIKIPNSGSNAVQGNFTPNKAYVNQVSDNIKRFEASKEESMRTMASGRDAVLIVCAEIGSGNAWSEEDIKDRIKMYAKWIKETIYQPPFVG